MVWCGVNCVCVRTNITLDGDMVAVPYCNAACYGARARLSERFLFVSPPLFSPKLFRSLLFVFFPLFLVCEVL